VDARPRGEQLRDLWTGVAACERVNGELLCDLIGGPLAQDESLLCFERVRFPGPGGGVSLPPGGTGGLPLSVGDFESVGDFGDFDLCALFELCTDSAGDLGDLESIGDVGAFESDEHFGDLVEDSGGLSSDDEQPAMGQRGPLRGGSWAP